VVKGRGDPSFSMSALLLFELVYPLCDQRKEETKEKKTLLLSHRRSLSIAAGEGRTRMCCRKGENQFEKG